MASPAAAQPEAAKKERISREERARRREIETFTEQKTAALAKITTLQDRQKADQVEIDKLTKYVESIDSFLAPPAAA